MTKIKLALLDGTQYTKIGRYWFRNVSDKSFRVLQDSDLIGRLEESEPIVLDQSGYHGLAINWRGA